MLVNGERYPANDKNDGMQKYCSKPLPEPEWIPYMSPQETLGRNLRTLSCADSVDFRGTYARLGDIAAQFANGAAPSEMLRKLRIDHIINQTNGREPVLKSVELVE